MTSAMLVVIHIGGKIQQALAYALSCFTACCIQPAVLGPVTFMYTPWELRLALQLVLISSDSARDTQAQ